jgi:glycosyltransferase involved in cell wall biosynthesis
MSKPLCVFNAPTFSRSGYGDWANSVGKSLLKYDKFDVLVAPTPWGNTPRKTNISELDQSDSLLLELANRVIKQPLQKQPELYIQMTIPSEFQTPGKFNIGITAGIETTVPPAEWIDGVNKMNVTFMPSKFSKDVFQSANFTKKYQDGREEKLVVNKPIEVLHWGADTNVFKKTSTKEPNLEAAMAKIPERFAFLFVGQWTNFNGLYSDRKDIGNLIRVFCSAFKDKKGERPALILKTSGVNFSKGDRDLCLSRILAIKKEVGGDLPNVYLLHGELTPQELNALYNHEKVRAHVSFTHGEGFGGPLLEASLSGKPVVASNWSGHLDFLNPAYAHLLVGTVKPIEPASVNQWLIKESSWFYVAYSLAEEKLKSLFYNPSRENKENAEKLRIENEQKFSLIAMDKIFHSYLDKYVPEFPAERKIVLPSLKKLALPKKIELPKNNI